MDEQRKVRSIEKFDPQLVSILPPFNLGTWGDLLDHLKASCVDTPSLRAKLRICDATKKIMNERKPATASANKNLRRNDKLSFSDYHYISLNANYIHIMPPPMYILAHEAAMWVLERLSSDGRIVKISSLLKRAKDVYSFAEFNPIKSSFPPNFPPKSTRYDDELVLLIFNIIYNKDRNSYPSGEYPLPYTEQSLSNTERPQSKYRELFEELMSFLTEEEIDSAVHQYRNAFDAVWAIMQKFNDAVSPCYEKIRAAYDRDLQTCIRLKGNLTKSASKLTTSVKNGKDKRREINGVPIETAALLNAFINSQNLLPKGVNLPMPELSCDPSIGKLATMVSDDKNEFGLSTKRLRDSWLRHRNIESALMFYDHHFLSPFPSMRDLAVMSTERYDLPPDSAIKNFNNLCAETACELPDFDSLSPFLEPHVLCFAILYLFDKNDDYIWVPAINYALYRRIFEKLPWRLYNHRLSPCNLSREEHYWEEYKHEGNEAFTPKNPSAKSFYLAHCEDQEVRKRKNDFFSPVSQVDWTTQHSSLNSEEHSSIANIIFNYTGYSIPDDMSRYNLSAVDFREYGFKKSDATAAITALTLLENMKHQIKLTDLLGASGEECEENADAGRKNIANENAGFSSADDSRDQVDPLTTIALLEKELSSAKTEIKKLKKEAYDAHRAFRDSSEKIAECEHELQSTNSELADLRSLVFNMQDEANESDDKEDFKEDDAALPYSVKNPIIVFGGHETWLKAIKQMLNGNIKFSTKVKNLGSLVQGNSLVWIQTNAISHPSFFSICDEAKKRGIPVRYFTNASARKCAIQVMEGDMQMIG